jgi:hypothetical protein
VPFTHQGKPFIKTEKKGLARVFLKKSKKTLNEGNWIGLPGVKEVLDPARHSQASPRAIRCSEVVKNALPVGGKIADRIRN